MLRNLLDDREFDHAATFTSRTGFGGRPALWMLAYPPLIWLGLETVGLPALAAVVLGLVLIRATPQLRAGQRGPLLASLAVAALVVAALASRDARFLLGWPVLVSVGLFAAFADSLRRGLPWVERIARRIDGELSPQEVVHCRRVTAVWCAFFLLNAAVAGWLAWRGPLSWWTLYTGLLSYLLMAILFAAEFLLRRRRFGRYGNGALERMVQRLVGSEADAPADWTGLHEKGSTQGLRFLLAVCRFLGRPAVRFVVRGVALYYTLTDAGLRRASRIYHERLGRQASFGVVYRHVLRFSYVVVDRLFFAQGQTQLFRLERHGNEHVREALAEGRGGILLGAHFGSFEALRAAAEGDDFPLSIVGYFHNAQRINALLQMLDPELFERVIHVEPHGVSHIMKIRERVEAGELVGLLGDRVTPGAESVEVNFLGAPARFPTGGFAVAAALGCPVLLCFCVGRDPNVYEVTCERFADRIDAVRRDPQALKPYVQQYAERLEAHVRRTPDNWFNFYDFWQRGDPSDATRGS